MEFYYFLSSRISELEKDEENIFYTDMYLQLNALFAFYSNIFGNTNKKFTKRLFDLNKKVRIYLLILYVCKWINRKTLFSVGISMYTHR